MQKNTSESQQETEKFTPRQLSPELVTACEQHFALEATSKASCNAKKLELQSQMDEFTKPFDKETKDSHDALWSEIYAAHPDLDAAETHHIDVNYMAQGVVMLTKEPNRLIK